MLGQKKLWFTSAKVNPIYETPRPLVTDTMDFKNNNSDQKVGFVDDELPNSLETSVLLPFFENYTEYLFLKRLCFKKISEFRNIAIYFRAIRPSLVTNF